MDSVWPNGELYFDEDEAFKKALGTKEYKNWWLLMPSVASKAMGYVRQFGMATNDVVDKKTKLMGGVFVVLNGEVVYTHRETTSFDNGDAREILAAVLQKDVKDLPALNATPKEEEIVCTRK